VIFFSCDKDEKVKIDNDIITANLHNTCFQSGKIVLMAYHSESSKYVKQQIKYGLYDYNLTIIYNSILQSKRKEICCT
jgi:hypothetical protein